jgi:subtilisin family serine protease
MGGNSIIFNAAVQKAIDAGISVVDTAGNEDQDASSGSPANRSNAIIIAVSNKRY